MPIHDWTRVDPGLFHAFRLSWVVAISDWLNNGGLPPEYYALMTERSRTSAKGDPALYAESVVYAQKADRIAIYREPKHVVAYLDVVSPGHKQDRQEFLCFVNMAVEFIRHGVHVVLIDLFPPGVRDPKGLHKPIWDEFRDEPFQFPAGKERLLASYDAGPPWVAYVEPVGVGDTLRDMPLFLKPEIYVPLPLEPTYQSAWKVFPKALKGLLGRPE